MASRVSQGEGTEAKMRWHSFKPGDEVAHRDSGWTGVVATVLPGDDDQGPLVTVDPVRAGGFSWSPITVTAAELDPVPSRGRVPRAAVEAVLKELGDRALFHLDGSEPTEADAHAIAAQLAPVCAREFLDEIVEAQADIQTPLGQYKLRHGDDDLADRLTKALARLHRLLDSLGHPMYDPATHPEIESRFGQGVER